MLSALPVRQPRPPVYAPVRSMVLYQTQQCNLRCDYCFVDKQPRRMSSETMRKAVDLLLSRDFSGGERRVTLAFFGGEPFLELALLEEAVAYARRPRPGVYKRVEFCATTNATVATPRVERLIREARMALMVSVDGTEAAARHRPFASGRPSYRTVARNLPLLAAWSPNAVVRMTFHPDALDLAANVRWALEAGAPAVALCPVVEADWRGHEEALEAAFQELADWFLAEARRGSVLPLEVTLVLLRQLHAVHTKRTGRPPRPCGVGTHLMSVDPDGNLMPCHRFLHRPQEWLGTVERPDLSGERMRYVHLSSADILGCDACEARSVCGGGCRVVALNSGRGLEEAHPGHCLVTRAHARAVFRIYDTLAAEGSRTLARLLRGERDLPAPLAELALG